MNLRKLGGLAVVAFLIFFALTNPTEAAGVIRHVANGVGAFFSALATGGH
jgi:hypothetical protein